MSDTAKTKVKKPRAKRVTMADLRKENEAIKATNMKLLGDIGKLSAMYMNEIAKNDKISGQERFSEKESALVVLRRIVAFLMHTYGFAAKDIFNQG